VMNEAVADDSGADHHAAGTPGDVAHRCPSSMPCSFIRNTRRNTKQQRQDVLAGRSLSRVR
jgi:hypothetical protein